MYIVHEGEITMKEFFRQLFQKKATVDYVDLMDSHVRRYVDDQVSKVNFSNTQFVDGVAKILKRRSWAIEDYLGIECMGDIDGNFTVKKVPAKKAGKVKK